MLTPMNSSLYERILNYACNIDDRATRTAINDCARQLIGGDDVETTYEFRLDTVTQQFEMMANARYATNVMKAQFQHCADFCYEEAAHREFFSIELPF